MDNAVPRRRPKSALLGLDCNPARREDDFEFVSNFGIELGEHLVRQKDPRRFANLYDLQRGDHRGILEEGREGSNANWLENGWSLGNLGTVAPVTVTLSCHRNPVTVTLRKPCHKNP